MAIGDIYSVATHGAFITGGSTPGDILSMATHGWFYQLPQPAQPDGPSDVDISDAQIIDLTGAPNGALPGQWEFFVISTDAAGAISGAAEASPATYFKVQSGLGYWVYTRSPAVPPPATPFTERGFVASPVGVITSRNATLAVEFIPPTSILDVTADSFTFEIFLGVRSNDDTSKYSGGRVRAVWTAGTWIEPFVLDAIQFASISQPDVLATAVFVPPRDPLDFWRAYPYAEMRIIARDGAIEVSCNGTRVAAGFIALGSGKPVVAVRVYHVKAGAVSSAPCIRKLSLLNLRDLARLGAPASAFNATGAEATQLPAIHLPVKDLSDKGYLKRIGARSWQFVRDVEVDAQGMRTVWSIGDIIRSTETFNGQEFVPIIPDLAAIRARKEQAV